MGRCYTARHFSTCPGATKGRDDSCRMLHEPAWPPAPDVQTLHRTCPGPVRACHPKGMAHGRYRFIHFMKISRAVPTAGLLAVSLVLGACPYTDPDDPDPLALELRRGVVERILERTSAGKADVAYLPDPANPVRVLVRLTERDEPRRRPRPTRVRFFGGAEEAAEAAVIDVDPDETPATLGELLAELSARRPRLAAVLDVSSFIVDHRTATRRTPLHAGADVEVLPPFSGG